MRWTITVLTLCFTFSTSSFGQPAEFDDPHGKLRGFDGTFREDGRLPAIVLLAPPDLPELSFDRPETREARRDQITRLVAEVLRTHPAVEVRHRYENFAGFHSAITEDQLVALLDDPRVQSIEPTHEVTAQTRQGIPAIGATRVREALAGGQGVSVAICDTGVDVAHPALGGGGFPNVKVIGGYDFGQNDGDPRPDGEEHGTAVAGIAAGDATFDRDYIGGVANGAKIYALKITPDALGDPETSCTGCIVAAWDWCVTHQFDDPLNPILVANTSFGAGMYTSACDTTFPALAVAAQSAESAGICLVVSAGNDGQCDAIQQPACISTVISVGAYYDAYIPAPGHHWVESSSCVAFPDGASPTGYSCEDAPSLAGQVTCYSNSAPILDVVAPSDHASTPDILGLGGGDIGDYLLRFNGTSAAAPYVTGAIALIQAAAIQTLGTPLSPAQVRQLLTSTGTPSPDPKSGVSYPRIDTEAAISTFVPTWNLAGAQMDTVATLFADNHDNSPFPFVFQQSATGWNAPMASSAWGGQYGAGHVAVLRDLFFRGTKTYVTSYGTGIASINGLGTPFVTIDWFEVAANSVSVFEDYDGTSLNVMTVAAELGIAPKPMVPAGTPVTVSWSWSGVSFATTEHESFSEDFCEVRDTGITIDGTEVTGGGFDLPAFTFPTKNQFAVFPPQPGTLPAGHVVGDLVPVQVTGTTETEVHADGKKEVNFTGVFWKDVNSATFRGAVTLSLLGPLNPPVTHQSYDEVHLGFSVDVGSDSELSDPQLDGDETLDPGDLYAWRGPFLPYGGANGAVDDSSWNGFDPIPDPLAGPSTGLPTCSGGPVVPGAHDVDGWDDTDLPISSFIGPAPPTDPIPRFSSNAIFLAQNLVLSFDDDDAEPYSGPGASCSIPIDPGATLHGSRLHGDELLAGDLLPAVPSAWIDPRPFADEAQVHVNLSPPPLLGPAENDDVDAISLKPHTASPLYHYFSVDHEAPLGYDPGAILEFDGVAVNTVVDPSLHLGLPPGVDLDGFAWCFVYDVNSGQEVLTLLFSVDEDDPFTPADESGGLAPDELYASFLTGSSVPFLDAPPRAGADIDAITVPHTYVRDRDYQFQFDSTHSIELGYDGGTGVGLVKVPIGIHENSRSPSYPTPALGFGMALTHDASLLSLTDVSLVGPVAQLVASAGGFVATQIAPDGFTLGVTFDPLLVQTLEFPTQEAVVVLTYEAVPAATIGVPELDTWLRWSEVVGGLGFDNQVTDGTGFAVAAHVQDIFVKLKAGAGQCFRRGDCDDSGFVDVGDAIALLSFIFGGGTSPGCTAACDANASGSVNLADAIALLNSIFTPGAPPLPPPGNSCGRDVGANCMIYTSCGTCP